MKPITKLRIRVKNLEGEIRRLEYALQSALAAKHKAEDAAGIMKNERERYEAMTRLISATGQTMEAVTGALVSIIRETGNAERGRP